MQQSTDTTAGLALLLLCHHAKTKAPVRMSNDNLEKPLLQPPARRWSKVFQ
jgi:hypothetical protein